MLRILMDDSLAHVDDICDTSVHLTKYRNRNELLAHIEDQDVLLCRSTLLVNEALLAGSNIACVATASSGIDHIDTAYLQSKQLRLLDAKGANARSVADYVLACVAYLQSQLACRGQRAGIIGAGAVGSMVAERLKALGFDVVVYDPLKASQTSDFISVALEELFLCDMLCVHANLHDDAPFPSRNLLNADFLAHLKPKTVIINASRGGILEESALLNSPQPLIYCTDVYEHEPNISSQLIAYATLCTPHIAGHSIEARKGMMVTAVRKIHELYGLTMKKQPFAHEKYPMTSSVSVSWQQAVLSIYNPMLETQLLKQSCSVFEGFLIHRQAHRMRHDFNCYVVSSEDVSLQQVLDSDRGSYINRQ